MERIFLAATLAAVSLTATSAAQDTYISGQFGLRAVEQTEGSAPGVDIDAELGNAGYFSGAIGRRNDGWRYEAELAYRGGALDKFDVNGVAQAATGDGLSATSLMANAYLDFNRDGRFTPYIGAGAGIAWVDADISGSGGVISNSDSALAFQLIGGVSMSVSERIELFSDFRYFRAMETEHLLTAPLGSSDVSFDYDGYTLGAGVRVSF